MTGRQQDPENGPENNPENEPENEPEEQGIREHDSEGGEPREESRPPGSSMPRWARPDGDESDEDPRDSGPNVPRWARPAGDRANRAGWRDWRETLRHRLTWPVVVLVVLFAVWSNYPFIPNPWAVLFRQPDGDATALSSPQRWAMYGAGPQGGNYIADAEPPRGVVAYTVNVDGGVRSAPAVSGGRVYVGGQSRISAYDAGSGDPVWERAVNGPAHGTPAVTDGSPGLVYLGLLGTEVLALDAASGETAWEYDGDSPFPGSVTLHDGIVYAPSRGGHVLALDAESGDLLWKVDAGDPVVAPVAVHDGRMFAASTGGVLYIRNARTGDQRARIRTGGALVSPPVVDGEQLYLLFEGDLLAFDTTVRELPGRYPAELVWAQLWIWHFPLPTPPEHSGLQWRVTLGEGLGDFVHLPSVTPEALYVGTDEGFVVALNREDGSELWRMAAGSELRRVDGNLSWRMPVGGAVAAPVLVAGDLLVVAQEDGTVRAMDRFSREEAWAVSLDSPLVAPLSYADGAVYAHTEDGRLHVIR